MMRIANAVAFPLVDVPRLSVNELRTRVLESVAHGGRLVLLGALPIDGPASPLSLVAVAAPADRGSLLVACAELSESDGGRAVYPSLTPDCPQAHLFEREIAESTPVIPEGHPWLKPVRYTRDTGKPCGTGEFYRISGADVHEVAVGPVHAGVIEPGHFRFQCHGEEVIHLEIALGYQHRGVERALLEGRPSRRRYYIETLAGDTSVGQAVAWCRASEALSGVQATARGEAIRFIALELERLANHTGDMGALAGDVGFLPTNSYCGRLRGDILNATATICGNRFGRGLVVPGGVQWDIDDAMREDILGRLAATSRDLTNAIGLLWSTPTVVSRFEGVGILPGSAARDLGAVGVTARASGVPTDVRYDLPLYGSLLPVTPPITEMDGDVNARAKVRRGEIEWSVGAVRQVLQELPAGPARTDLPDWQPGHAVVSLSEGWRGEICHLLVTDAAGALAAVKIIDPSFHNWQALAYAMRDQQISDFPLCNKSFNLSYCGHDL